MDGFLLLSDFVLQLNQLCVCILILTYNIVSCSSLSLFALVKDLLPTGISVQHDHLNIKISKGTQIYSVVPKELQILSYICTVWECVHDF